MTPKEKAINLFIKFSDHSYEHELMSKEERDYQTKQCALIAVEEMLWIVNEMSKHEGTDFGYTEYWQEVKQEIEKL